MKFMKGMIVAGLIAAVLPAMAGYKAQNQIVGVDRVNRSAYGEMSGARNSADSNQWISCNSTRYPGNFGFAYCQAVDVNGNYIFALTYDLGLIEHLSHIPSDAYVSFSWDANGTLTNVSIEEASYRDPKH